MGIEIEYKKLLKKIRHDGKKDYKALAKKIRIPYSTLLKLSKGPSAGTIRSWVRIGRYYKRIDAK